MIHAWGPQTGSALVTDCLEAIDRFQPEAVMHMRLAGMI